MPINPRSMKTPALLASTLCVLLATTSNAQLLPFTSPSTAAAANNNNNPAQNPAAANPPHKQSFMAPSDVIISDVIQRTRSINIFAGFTRDIDSVSSRLDASGSNTTVLAPSNSVIQALPRKPWEDPSDYENVGAKAYEGAEGSGRAAENLERFVAMHVVPVSPWKEGEKVKSLGGNELWWEKKDGIARVSSYLFAVREG